jgi:NADH-quinone oxidoreductase subunit G
VSAQPADLVSLEIDGRPVAARKGQMVIQAADAAGIYIPRFCYHKKLSVAANCRMCLVEVEKSPKPLPACATPVTEGMKVFTQSVRAQSAQQNVMEFLLVNHPLDCPVCDQGGECELQDLALGFGRSSSAYSEGKRAVQDKDIGPLIATELTRCIHCTRCVRFGEEIAGMRELGMTGRGERSEIGTVLAAAVESEVSGNVIDLCPVGALTAKPSRFSARPWEVMQHPSVAPHDCLGSNVQIHTLRNRVVRVAPRENESINETWLSDRDRFSYEGLEAADRLTQPMVRDHGQWRTADWNTALQVAAERLRAAMDGAGEALGVWVSPSSTLEEMWLAQRMARALECPNVEHRLWQQDFRDQVQAAAAPLLGVPLAEVQNLKAGWLIGANPRKDQPLLALRMRRAAAAGADWHVLHARPLDCNFAVASEQVQAPTKWVEAVARVARAVQPDQMPPAVIARLLEAVEPTAADAALAQNLKDAGAQAVIWLGPLAQSHPRLAEIRALAAFVASVTGAILGELTLGSNAAGGWLSGCVPHREPGGKPAGRVGLHLGQMLAQPRKALLLVNIEPPQDLAAGAGALKTLAQSQAVVALSTFDSPALREHAQVLLPVAAYAENEGSFMNAEGRLQAFSAAVSPPGGARPAWKVLRRLADVMAVPGCAFDSFPLLHEAAARDCQLAGQGAAYGLPDQTLPAAADTPLAETGLYAVDAIVRRAPALQRTADARAAVFGGGAA